MNAYSARDELSVFWGDVHGKWVQRSVGFTDGRGVWGRMDTCIRMAEYLCRPPETITTLLTGFTPSQNNQFKSIYITTKKVLRDLEVLITREEEFFFLFL